MIQKKFNTAGLAKFFETKKPLVWFGLLGVILGVFGVYGKRDAGFAEMLGAFDSGLSISLSMLALASVYVLVSEQKERAQRHKNSLEQMEQNANKKGAILIFINDKSSAESLCEQAKIQMQGAKFLVKNEYIESIIIPKDRMSLSDMIDIKQMAKKSYSRLIENGVDLIYIAGRMPLAVGFMLGDEFGNQTPCIFCHFEGGVYEPWYETTSGMIATPNSTITNHFHPVGELQ